jgi:hypothetical protein
MLRFPRIPLAVALLALLPACDTVGDDSAFTATLEGAVDARLEGAATFSPVGGDRFQLLLRLDEGDSDGFRGSLGFSRDGTARPGEGTYPIGGDDPDAFDVTIILTDDQGAIALEARSGTLTVTESSEDLLEGAFAFEAGTVFGGGDTTVEGTFTAEPG